MLRNFLLGTTVALVSTSALPALAQSNSTTEQGGTMSAVPQDTILATSIIGMPTFIKGEETTAGPIGALVDALVSLDGQIVGVVIRTAGNSAFIVPADRLEQASIGGRPILVINVTRDEAENAPDVSSQLPQGQQPQDQQSQGTSGTNNAGTDATSNNAPSSDGGSNATNGADSSASSDGSSGSGSTDTSDSTSSDNSSSGNGTSDSSGSSSSGTDTSGTDTSDTSGTNGQTGVTGTTTDGTNAAGADEGSDGTGTEGRAGTDGDAPNTGN